MHTRQTNIILSLTIVARPVGAAAITVVHISVGRMPDGAEELMSRSLAIEVASSIGDVSLAVVGKVGSPSVNLLRSLRGLHIGIAVRQEAPTSGLNKRGGQENTTLVGCTNASNNAGVRNINKCFATVEQLNQLELNFNDYTGYTHKKKYNS
ncbi:hypothetical protein GUITHDRAFT_153214 [Guillardia theta CCMP2712]|uniref:Uncharacterized protein n=1 Tax=Guillardia theta (strain CCMP2712) TaxID=905079 RepID=L1J514_GUITC|nr:hypothetical protein GUITHDRAFT_153214 [Guillardia theta CCMP2712]EKX43601.1 hypothetical protein GUITHDRAFT_153214 [Guillardia theta CCMP2712]|eukprot:XP_005830581.1 hypothetical protein GUITHDRAFT_153214 [Guillardia theta CCMP2712]